MVEVHYAYYSHYYCHYSVFTNRAAFHFPPFKFMLFFMPLMKVFTVQTYFQGNKADSCTLSFSSPFSSSPHLWFPLGSRHLALLLSEVVIYKHQFVSIQTRDWLFSASLTIQLVQIKTMCVTLCVYF